MDNDLRQTYRFKSFLLNVKERQLLHDDTLIPLTPKSFDTLVHLVEHAGHLVGKEELMQSVWSDSFVEEGNLSRTIHDLRRALGQNKNGNKFIETVPTKGYRFVAEVSNVHESGEQETDSTKAAPADIEAGQIQNEPRNQSREIDDPEAASEIKARPRMRIILATVIFVGAVSLLFLLSFSFRSESFFESNKTAEMRSTTSEEAYRLYLQGRALTEKHNRKDIEKGIAYLEQAVNADPNYALAYTQLANAHSVLSMFGGNIAESQLKQRAAIEKALSLNDKLAEAHALLGEMKLVYEWDFDGAESSFRRALELDPNSMVVHRLYALYLSSMGRHDEAIAEAKLAIDLEPASVLNHKNYGQFLYFARRYDEAIEVLERTIEIDADYRTAYGWLMRSLRQKGDDDKAFEYFLRAPKRKNEDPEKTELWKTIYARSGWRGITQKELDEALEDERNGEDRYWVMPRLYAELGENEKAMTRLQMAFDANQRGWGWTVLKIDQTFDALHPDPRFEAIVKSIGLK